jgi:hypothetical protein
MLIKNYGHLWERKYLNYGGPGVRGQLLGYIDTKTLIDFRDQIGVYVLYDKDFIPVYVGQAGNGHKKLFDRLKQHETDHLWNRWDSFSWFGVRGVNQNGNLSNHDKIDKVFKTDGSILLNEFEAILIAAMEPKLNKRGPCWKDVDQYFQEIDEKMEDIKPYQIMEKVELLEKMMRDIQRKK